jgi:hypothetical protein
MYRPNKYQKRNRQAGFALLSTLLALVIAALLARQQMEGSQIKLQMDAGRIEGQVATLISEATNNFTMENYPALQNNLPVTKNGVTLAHGYGVGNSFGPTVAILVDMGYLRAGTPAESLYVMGGSYRIRLRKEPAGCLGIACNISGLVYIDRAAIVPGTTDMNAPMVGAFATQIGGSALFSTNANAFFLAGPAGVPVANPLGPTPGVLGVAVGFGAAGFGPFLVLNDPRNPNFQGDLTAKGGIESRTSVSVTNATDTCNLASLWVNTSSFSEFIVRSATCVQRAWIRGDGTIGVADAGGMRRADLDGNTGNISSYDSTGTKRSGFTYNAVDQSEAFADNLRNSAAPRSLNAAGVDIDGRVYGRLGQFDSVAITKTAGIYSTCYIPGEMVLGRVNGNAILLVCQGGSYYPVDGMTSVHPYDQLHGGCSGPAGATGRAWSSDVLLICEGGVWRPIVNRIGRVQMDNSIVVGTGTFIPAPACARGGTPEVILIPTAINAGTGVLTYAASPTSGGWAASIIDNSGAQSPGSRALAFTYCDY